MSEFQRQFEEISRAYRRSDGGPIAGTDERRRLYGLYKQATEGDVRGKQPGFFNFEDQGNFRAWKQRKGMPRDEARRRFVDLAKELGYRDPGDSPVPFISDETWRREESWVNPDYDKTHDCIHDPELIEVGDEDRSRAPKVATTEQSVLPPKDSDTGHLERLQATPETSAFQLYSPMWPVCCRRLTVLVGYRGVDEDVVDTVPEAYVLERDDSDDEFDVSTKIDDSEPWPFGEETLRQDLLMFHCHDCGSVYLSRHDG